MKGVHLQLKHLSCSAEMDRHREELSQKCLDLKARVYAGAEKTQFHSQRLQPTHKLPEVGHRHQWRQKTI